MRDPEYIKPSEEVIQYFQRAYNGKGKRRFLRIFGARFGGTLSRLDARERLTGVMEESISACFSIFMYSGGTIFIREEHIHFLKEAIEQRIPQVTDYRKKGMIATALVEELIKNLHFTNVSNQDETNKAIEAFSNSRDPEPFTKKSSFKK